MLVPTETTTRKYPITLFNTSAMAESLRAEGWIICPPGSVPMPRDRDDAIAMNLLSERYLKDQTP